MHRGFINWHVDYNTFIKGNLFCSTLACRVIVIQVYGSSVSYDINMSIQRNIIKFLKYSLFPWVLLVLRYVVAFWNTEKSNPIDLKLSLDAKVKRCHLLVETSDLPQILMMS